MSLQQTEGQALEAEKAEKWPVIVWVLYVTAFVTFGVTMLAGAILAYVKRPQLEGTPASSHMTYAICTAWVTAVAAVVGFVAPFEYADVVFLPLTLWQLVRIIRGFLRAVDGRPIDKPYRLF
jgi:uncharacterized membrane protein